MSGFELRSTPYPGCCGCEIISGFGYENGDWDHYEIRYSAAADGNPCKSLPHIRQYLEERISNSSCRLLTIILNETQVITLGELVTSLKFKVESTFMGNESKVCYMYNLDRNKLDLDLDEEEYDEDEDPWN